MGIKVIITGATGMVGEGVLLTCLNNTAVDEVLMINRRPFDLHHPKLKELIVPDFLKWEGDARVSNYDACFYCAGISSVGMSEEKYNIITYDTTLHFAHKLLDENKNMTFTFVSGSHTDSSEKGKIMWARIKGKTENALMKLGFKQVYNFRPGGMAAVKGQRNAKKAYEVIVAILNFFVPKIIITLQQLGEAMINVVLKGYPKQILEVKDIKLAARS